MKIRIAARQPDGLNDRLAEDYNKLWAVHVAVDQMIALRGEMFDFLQERYLPKLYPHGRLSDCRVDVLNALELILWDYVQLANRVRPDAALSTKPFYLLPVTQLESLWIDADAAIEHLLNSTYGEGYPWWTKVSTLHRDLQDMMRWHLARFL